MPLDIDSDYLLETLQRLVAVDSTNPEVAEDGAGEEEIAGVVEAMMHDLGLDVDVLEPEAGRPSVVGVLPSSGASGSEARSLMLNGHLDTVGVDGMEDPFTPRLEGRRLYGRGTQDMKGSLAAHLAAVKALRESDASLAADLIVAAVADEEHMSLGTEAVLARRIPDAAVVTEPTDLALCVAHKGFAWFDVTTRGRAAHGSRPEEGTDANLRMGRILGRLDDLESELRRRPGHPLAGTPSLHVGRIEGGTAPSVYAASCRARVERRTVPGETVGEVRRELEALLESVEAEHGPVDASLELAFSREPFEADGDSRTASAVEAAAENVLKATPDREGQTFWTDAGLLAAAGTDTVVIGPIGAGLHTTEEWVDVPSCVQLSAILAETAVAVCGTA
jgi:acetylornithine deacetylase